MEDKKNEVEKLSDADKNNLDLALMNKKLAYANAEKAIAQNENAELSYKYFVIQLYMKYGLKSSDSITESGEITREV